jgi:uncharacterized membrane protein
LWTLKIEYLLKQDPKYFEKTIAYAVAFGLTKKWVKKFKHLTTTPNWYGKNERDSFERFEHLERTLSSATVSLTSSTSSSSSSSYGGGSSSGGFGRGGGGSW